MHRYWRALLASAIIAIGAPAAAQQAPPAGETAPEAAAAPAAEGVSRTLAPLIERAMPAVVRIFTRKFVRRQLTSELLEEPIMRWLIGDLSARIGGRERVETSLGSGVIVRPDGTIVTAHHVIEGARDIVVILANHREYPARLVLEDPRTDLAILKIEAGEEAMPHLPFADLGGLRIGDFVVAIGNPFGVGQTVTTGIVSALARTTVGTTDFKFFIQTDAAINPGNSGGALIDLQGRLVGINSAIYSRTGGSVGIGFAVPANMVRAVVASAVSGKPLVRPWLGATGRGLPSDVAAMLAMRRPFGAFIVGVHPDGPFAEAGGRTGDVVLAVDGREVQDAEALRFQVATREVGSTLHLTLLRGPLLGEIEVELAAPPETPPPEERRLRGYHPLAGARVASLSPALAEELAIDSTLAGVVVLGISRGSAAAGQGLRRGDVVFEINGQPIKRVGDLAPFIRRPYPGWKVAVRRGDGQAVIEMSMVKL